MKLLKTYKQLVFLCLLSILFIGCSASKQYVGVRNFEVYTNANRSGFTAKLWFPTRKGIEQRFGVSRIRPGYLAVPDAIVMFTEQAPLFVLTHGSGGSADSMAWLAIELAKLGALVVAADHPASSGGDPERASMLEVWSQPEDVSLMLDELLDSDWKTHIDDQRIAVIGFSLGGASAISLAGGRLQFERFPIFCETHNDGACNAFRHLFGGLDADFYDRANADLSDSRLSAAVAIAPGFTESLTTESLQSLETPLLLIVAEKDQQLPPATHVKPVLRFLPQNSHYIEISEAQHFSFLPKCGDGAMHVLSETNEEFVCQEFGRKSREYIHKQTLKVIEEFFIANSIL